MLLDARALDPQADVDADVCIVGAGIAGLSIAYELSHAGQKVIVLDDGAIGRGMTARTTAHLVNALDDRYYDLEKFHGVDGAHLAAQSHSAAIDWIETQLESYGCATERFAYEYQPPQGPAPSPPAASRTLIGRLTRSRRPPKKKTIRPPAAATA